MIIDAKSLLNRIDISLDYIITLLSIGLEIYLQQNMNILQYFALGLLIFAGIAKIFEKKKVFDINQDFSPLFFWFIALLRIVFIKNIKKEQTIFWLYNLGFSNGQYMGMTNYRLFNQVTELVKCFTQFGVLIGILIYNAEEQIESSIYLIIIMVFIQYQNYRQNMNLIQKEQKDTQFYRNTNLNGSLNRILNKHNEQGQDSISRAEPSDPQIPNQVNIQPPTQKFLWNQFIEQSEDYIIKFNFNINDLENMIKQSQQNYQICKFLQDNKCSIVCLLKEIKISNELNVLLYESNNLDKRQDSLFDWINQNVNAQKFNDINYQRGLEENLVFSSPNIDQSIVMMDAFIQKSISGISIIQLVQGSLDVSNLRNRRILYGKYYGQKQIYNFYIQVSYFQEEICGVQTQMVAIILRDLEKQVRQIKTNLKNIQKIKSTIKFFQKQAELIQNLHQRVIKQKNYYEMQNSRQASQQIKRTNSIVSIKESVDDILLDVSEKGQKNCQLTLFMNQLQLQCMKYTQNNFNYFEVFSVNDDPFDIKKFDIKKADIRKVDITQSVSLLIDQFQFDDIVIQKKIKINLMDKLQNKFISTDLRRLKQLLFNIIYNSIQSYEYDNSEGQKSILIVLSNYKDNIHFKVIDNGVGLNEFNVNSNRIQECKLGLSASQKLIKLLGGNDKQLKIVRSQSKNQTKVIFDLPNILIIDKSDTLRDEFEYDTIQLVFTS